MERVSVRPAARRGTGGGSRWAVSTARRGLEPRDMGANPGRVSQSVGLRAVLSSFRGKKPRSGLIRAGVKSDSCPEGRIPDAPDSCLPRCPCTSGDLPLLRRCCYLGAKSEDGAPGIQGFFFPQRTHAHIPERAQGSCRLWVRRTQTRCSFPPLPSQEPGSWVRLQTGPGPQW